MKITKEEKIIQKIERLKTKLIIINEKSEGNNHSLIIKDSFKEKELTEVKVEEKFQEKVEENVEENKKHWKNKKNIITKWSVIQ